MNDIDQYSDLWFQTYTGKAFYPAKPTMESIDIEDIAHHLAHECRFGGAVDQFYSVAQHSVLASQMAPAGMELVALMHDAPEAYLKDIPRSLKLILGETYKKLERNLWEVMMRVFWLPAQIPPEIKVIDNRLLATERRDLMKMPPQPWKIDEAKVEPYVCHIIPWSPKEAKEIFYLTYCNIMRKVYDGVSQ